MRLNTLRAVRRFLADWRWLRQRGYGRREAWHWAQRMLPLVES